jgi:hypothetical protein
MKPEQPAPDPAEWVRAKSLYLEVLHQFYERGRPAQAMPAALSLLRLLDRLDPAAGTLPGNEYRAVIAELDGDLADAIRYRETVVRQLDELASDQRLTAAAFTAEEYADQLDLLATLYHRAGRLPEAEAVSERSAAVCREAGIEFDGADVRESIRRASPVSRPKPREGKRTRLGPGS